MWKGIWWQFCGCDQNKSLPVCEKEPISDYPVSQFITGECTKISYTLANLLLSHNSSYYVDDIDRAKYRPIDGQLIEIVGRQLSIEKFTGFTGHGVLFSAFGWIWMGNVSYMVGVNECLQHFITCTYPSFSPTYQCGLGKAIRFNVHAVYAVYGSLWLGNTPTLVNPGTTSEWWGKTTTGPGFHYLLQSSPFSHWTLEFSGAWQVITWSPRVFPQSVRRQDLI